jgi:hypothetical protein
MTGQGVLHWLDSRAALTRQPFEALAPDSVIEIDGECVTKATCWRARKRHSEANARRGRFIAESAMEASRFVRDVP